MTIYTKAEWTLAEGPCEGGVERTDEALARLGLDRSSMVSMQLILRELGLTDTLYSFVRVRGDCKKEAQEKLAKYAMEVAALAHGVLVLVYGEKLMRINRAINRRYVGGRGFNPECLQAQREVLELKREETNISMQHLLEAYSCLLSNKSDAISVTQATVAALDGASVANARAEVHGHLTRKLAEILGPDAHTGA